MFNKDKFKSILDAYKDNFTSDWYSHELYKWEAIKHFQDNWNINEEDFLDMFMRSTEKTYNLLANVNNFPRGMIKAFAEKPAKKSQQIFLSRFLHFIASQAGRHSRP